MQSYHCSNFGGVMIPQMPMNYVQNLSGQQVNAHTPTRQLVKSILCWVSKGPAQMLLHMKWQAQSGSGSSVPAGTLHRHASIRSEPGFARCWPPLNCWPLFSPHAVPSTSVGTATEATDCYSGDFVFTGNTSRFQCNYVQSKLESLLMWEYHMTTASGLETLHAPWRFSQTTYLW